jgi:hypothetical protein
LPHTSYTRSIDIWTGTSLTFIFLSVVEFVIVNYLNEYGRSGSCSTRSQKQIQDTSDAAEQQAPLNPCGDEKCSSQMLAAPGHCKLGASIDIIFRIAIPLLFVVFVMVYFLVVVLT